MGKVKSGSKLLQALGKTKKEQMKVLYPKVKSKVRGKGPYLRGKVSGSGDFLKRREVLGGRKVTGTREAVRPTKPSTTAAVSVPLGLAAAGVTGYQMGKKKGAKNLRAEQAKKAADAAIKKQKEKKKEQRMRRRRLKK